MVDSVFFASFAGVGSHLIPIKLIGESTNLDEIITSLPPIGIIFSFFYFSRILETNASSFLPLAFLLCAASFHKEKAVLVQCIRLNTEAKR